MGLVFAIAGVFAILATSELLWRKGIIKDEAGRKFVHILVGVFVAFWPHFLTYRQIEFMSLAFLVGIIVSRYGMVFHAVHGISRKSQGDFLFPIGIGLAALLMPSPIVFTAGMLHLALADGLAAIIGTRYGSVHYRIRNYAKSLAGTAMFYLTSTIIVTGTVLIAGDTITWPLVPLLVWLPLAATVVENFAVGGLDNILVPLLVIVVLQSAHIG